jgi:hypothetical protein
VLVARLLEVATDLFGEHLDAVLDGALRLAVASRSARGRGAGLADAAVAVEPRFAVGLQVPVLHAPLGIHQGLDLNKLPFTVRNLQDSCAAGVGRNDPGGSHILVRPAGIERVSEARA